MCDLCTEYGSREQCNSCHMSICRDEPLNAPAGTTDGGLLICRWCADHLGYEIDQADELAAHVHAGDD